MTETKPSFEQMWAEWLAGLSTLETLATTASQRATALRARQVIDSVDTIALLCHDVKDPLASVLMGTTLLQKTRGSEPVIETIAAAARRLDRIVTGAHELALLRRGDFQVRLRSLPLESLVTTVVENHRKTVTKIAIDLELALDGVNVLGDPSATSRIVSELLHNATGFSTDGATVTVRVAIEGDEATIRVSDVGPGIDADHLPHVFDETRNRAHRPRRGAGRGLPIAQALAELQKATLTLAPRDPIGCEATIRMQLAPRGQSPQA